jgi:predicted membrane channel-forming protein YqfA (hemolysin III family)
MKSFLKFLGVGIVLLGVAWLAIPFFTHLQTNTSLLTGWILIVAGFITYVIINKKIL